MRLGGLAYIALALASGGIGQAATEPISPDQVRVIDGDTVRLFNMAPNVRLVGFNAPETRRAKCDSERQLGDQATRRVRDLVHSEVLEFEYVDCACPPGTEETPGADRSPRMRGPNLQVRRPIWTGLNLSLREDDWHTGRQYASDGAHEPDHDAIGQYGQSCQRGRDNAHWLLHVYRHAGPALAFLQRPRRW